MKKLIRKFFILKTGRIKLFRSMRRQRYFAILNKGTSVFNRVFTVEELEYLYENIK